MNTARIFAYAASPLTIANVGAWAIYAQKPFVAAFFAGLGIFMAYCADWSDVKTGVRQ